MLSHRAVRKTPGATAFTRSGAVRQTKFLNNNPIQIRAALASHREDLVGVVIEATYNWYWLVDELIEDGYRVHLANPAAIRQYASCLFTSWLLLVVTGAGPHASI